MAPQSQSDFDFSWCWKGANHVILAEFPQHTEENKCFNHGKNLELNRFNLTTKIGHFSFETWNAQMMYVSKQKQPWAIQDNVMANK